MRRPGVFAALIGSLLVTAIPADAIASIESFACVGGSQSWTVPAGVTEIHVTAVGAQGGSVIADQVTINHGGFGGLASATLAVTPGEVLDVNVGCGGQSSRLRQAGFPGLTGPLNHGFLGGGHGGAGTPNLQPPLFYGGAQGGGASDVRRGGSRLKHRILVAGGGGGAASGGAGGPGGGGRGSDAPNIDANSGQGNAGGGGGGTATAGGRAAADGAQAGSLGQGGSGESWAWNLPQVSGGGGGGGGWFGGGGGAAGWIYPGGGGGGSGMGPPGYTSATGYPPTPSPLQHTGGDGRIWIAFN
jgi:Glycine rich protein